MPPPNIFMNNKNKKKQQYLLETSQGDCQNPIKDKLKKRLHCISKTDGSTSRSSQYFLKIKPCEPRPHQRS